jgi:hypothetical protein
LRPDKRPRGRLSRPARLGVGRNELVTCLKGNLEGWRLRLTCTEAEGGNGEGSRVRLMHVAKEEGGVVRGARDAIWRATEEGPSERRATGKVQRVRAAQRVGYWAGFGIGPR